jgi:fatty-acyl-CoA synthase
VSFDELAATGDPAAWVPPPVDPDRLAILQFTSGSTADPKGVMVPHRCMTTNLDAAAEAADFDHDVDTAVSWLPLYHDMGLIGLLGAPMLHGFDLVLASPQDFLGAPARWMEWMAEFGGTVTAGPNFAYALAARALGRLDRLDLSRWRLAVNGAEPIDPDAVESFLTAAASHGVDPHAAFCVFGMAEATLAVTFPTPGTGMQVDAIDQRVLETDRYAAPVDFDGAGGNARRLPRLGRPLRGLEMRVCDPTTGQVMHDREVGEVELRGSSITPGYYGNPQATADAHRGDWFRTGDLGYVVDGELVVCGRLKDVIIVGGRNVFPEDVERAAESVEGVRAGNVIAFGTEGRRGREAVVVVAETKLDEITKVRDAVAARVTDAVGVPPEVVLVRPGTLPKTSSGKPQRSLCRRRYLGDDLAPV